MKKFMDGLIFGAGFGVAFVVVAFIGFNFFLVPAIVEPTSYEASRPDSSVQETFKASKLPHDEEKLMLPYHELEIEDQIKYASVIAVVEFQPGNDGKKTAKITDILKKDDGVEFYYAVGDEYALADYYSNDGTVYGDGMVMLFTGSPASLRASMTYSGERIGSLGDMPLKLFREKCDPPGK